MTPFDLPPHREAQHEATYDAAMAEAERCLSAGHLLSAKHAFARAHALGRDQTRTHVRAHLGLVRVALAAGAWLEVAAQLLLVGWAQLFTRSPRETRETRDRGVAALPESCIGRS